jgi:hypothetical protein
MINLSHTYSAAGTYCAKVRAEDSKGNSSAWSECHTVTITAPSAETPTIPTISGTGSGVVGTPYPIKLYASDPQGDQIKYEAQLTANYSSPNTFTYGPYNSGTTLTVNINYGAGSYCVKARAIDSKGNASAFSPCHNATISTASAVPAAAFTTTIGAQVNGTSFPITLTTTNIPANSSITLSSSMGTVYPSAITLSGTTYTGNVYITSAMNTVTLNAKYNNTTIGASNSLRSMCATKRKPASAERKRTRHHS